MQKHKKLWGGLFLVLMLVQGLLLFCYSSATAERDSTMIQAAANSSLVTLTPADVLSIMKQMKDLFEPVRPCIQKVSITTSERGGKKKSIIVQAFKRLADGKRRLIIVQEPEELKGSAALLWEPREKKPDVIWVYIPTINRVRELLGIDQYDTFFGTTFKYADLGFMKLHDRYVLLGEETCEGKQAYKVAENRLPDDYYSRIINWIAVDTKLPIKREFYSRGRQLWKTEFFKDISIIDGTPTPVRVLMTLVDGRTSTELKLTEVNYDVPIPDELFNPDRLATVAAHPVWKSYRPQPVQKH
jgi:hypothetical protein